MGAGRTLLDPADVQGRGFKVHLIPPQIDQFGHPQAVPVGDKHHGGVPVVVAIALRRAHELLDLGRGQVHAGAQVAVAAALGRTCFDFRWLA